MRLDDKAWPAVDGRVLDKLLGSVQNLVWGRCDGMSLEEIRKVLSCHNPRIKTGRSHAHILYAPGLIFEEDGQLKMAARGEVYEQT